MNTRLIKLTPAQLKATQKVQVEMLLEIDRVCKENNIKYGLFAGTLLGAIRHKGYIPWDDDADVYMMREEYDRFREIFAEKCNQDKFYFVDIENTPGYRWGYGKVKRKNSLWLREAQSHLNFGQEIFVDVFPIDGVPNGFLQGWLFHFCCFLVRKILWSEVGQYKVESAFLRLLYRQLFKIPKSSVLKAYRKLAYLCKGKTTSRYRMLTFPMPKGTCYEFKKQWIDTMIDVEFEGYPFKTLHNYAAYLSHKYGDYMTLPPENQRKVHPLTEFKLPPEFEVDD